MNQSRILFFLLIFFSVPSFAQTEQAYTPPPMFGTPVVIPQSAPVPAPVQQQPQQPTTQPPVTSPTSAPPVVTNNPIPITPPVMQPTPIIPAPVKPPYVQQRQTAPTQLQPQTVPIIIAPSAPSAPSPVPIEPTKVETQQKTLPQKKSTPTKSALTKSAPIKSAGTEELLNHPVTAAPSPNAIDPLMASQIAKSHMPKPKDGDVIDDTGVDPSKVRYPSQKPVTPAKPIIEDTPKKTEKPKSKTISTEQQKMPVVTTKNVEEISLAPMPNVKVSNPKPADIKSKDVKKVPVPATTSPTKQSLAFAAGAGDLTPAHKSSLTTIVAELKAKPSARAQILSYATPTNATGSMSARRVSLTRGLAIRTHLLSQGVESARVDVRALGDETEGKTKLDQADVVIME